MRAYLSAEIKFHIYLYENVILLCVVKATEKRFMCVTSSLLMMVVTSLPLLLCILWQWIWWLYEYEYVLSMLHAAYVHTIGKHCWRRLKASRCILIICSYEFRLKKKIKMSVVNPIVSHLFIHVNARRQWHVFFIVDSLKSCHQDFTGQFLIA